MRVRTLGGRELVVCADSGGDHGGGGAIGGRAVLGSDIRRQLAELDPSLANCKLLLRVRALPLRAPLLRVAQLPPPPGGEGPEYRGRLLQLTDLTDVHRVLCCGMRTTLMSRDCCPESFW